MIIKSMKIRLIVTFSMILIGVIILPQISNSGPSELRDKAFDPLKLYWSAERRDNFTTTTKTGERAAKEAGYKFVRIEGCVYTEFVRNNTMIPLKLYWSYPRRDNLSTTKQVTEKAALEAGYGFARIQGYITKNNQYGLIPLKLYYNSARKDHYLTSTQEGEKSAIESGYGLVGIQGYIVPKSWCD